MNPSLRKSIMIQFYQNNKLIIKFVIGFIFYFTLALMVSSALTSCLSSFTDKLNLETKASLKEDKRVLTQQLETAVKSNEQIKNDIITLSSSYDEEMKRMLLHEKEKKVIETKVVEIKTKHEKEIKVVKSTPKHTKKDVLNKHYDLMMASYELAKGENDV